MRARKNTHLHSSSTASVITVGVAQVRDAWAAAHTPAPRTKPHDLVSHAQDLWEDARLEQVMAWLEDHLRGRRAKTRI